MRLYIVADMEGVTGVTHRDQLLESGGQRYWSGCALLTADINAVIEGAVAEGVTDVLVSEGHANMRNVLVDDLHPAARVLRGPARWETKPLCQIGALTNDFDLAMFVGFHSRAGTPKGLLAHTWASAVVHELRLNGREVGETAINAAILGDAGVPVTLVCGGDDLAREALADLGSVETAIVKQVHGFDLASCWGPKRTLPLLREAASRAVTRHREGAFQPFIIEGPVVAEVTVLKDAMAERMSLVPGVERTARRTIRVGGATATEALSGAWRAIQEVFHEPAGWLR